MIFMLDPLKENINQKLQRDFVKTIQLTTDRKQVPLEAQAQEELKESIGKALPDK